jgi:hypothetical protein
MPSLAVAALALVLPIQATNVPREPAKDLFLHSAKLPGLEVRFVDYHWQPAIFEAMESGKGDVPEAKRNWVVIRLMVDDRPVAIDGKKLAVGTYAVTLWPNLDGQGMQVEVRRVDMRDVFPDLNAMAPAPRGETIHKAPAGLETVSPLAERLDVQLGEAGGAITIALRYGPRRMTLKLTR